jgi:cytochrome c biogenesis protein CcmG/thiol:disulfide interchange protein DsbE
MTEPASQRRSGSGLFWALLAAAVVVVVVGVAFASRFGVDPDLTASPLIGTPTPDVTIPYLESDESLQLRDLDGDIVVVNFWASWCTGCRQEHEALVVAADAYEELGVTFVGVNYQDQPGRAVAFLDDLGRSPATHYVEDVGSRTAVHFGVLGLPETFFIGRDGIVAGKVSGPLTAPLLINTLDRMLVGEDISGEVKTGEVENLGD